MLRQVVIDARCTLNLPATRRELEIVGGLRLHLLDTPQVCGEILTLWTPPDADGQRTKETTSPKRLGDAGHLETRPLDVDTLVDAFVAAGARIKDADASCIALTGGLGLPLMTDDRKERRIARDLFPAIELVSTLDVFSEAEKCLGWPPLISQRWRATFGGGATSHRHARTLAAPG